MNSDVLISLIGLVGVISGAAIGRAGKVTTALAVLRNDVRAIEAEVIRSRDKIDAHVSSWTLHRPK